MPASKQRTKSRLAALVQLWLALSVVHLLTLFFVIVSPAASSPSTLTIRALMERANLSWSILFNEQQQALKGVKSLIEAKNIIDCYAKHSQFNVRHQKYITSALSNRSAPTQKLNSSQALLPQSSSDATLANRSRSAQSTKSDSNQQQLHVTYLLNNASFCVPDVMGGVCFPPHPAGRQYYYLCMDDLELKREILDSCPDYNRYSEPAYAARLCSVNATWAPTIDYDSTRSITLPNGTQQPTLPCLSLLEQCYRLQLGRDSNDNARTANVNQSSLLAGGAGDSATKNAVASDSCSTKKSDTVRQIGTLVALLDLCFSIISFILLCVTLFIFIFFKSLHCGRISIHTNLAASLLLRTALHIFFMAYKLFGDYSRQQYRRRAAEAAKAVTTPAPTFPVVAEMPGDIMESLGIGTIASFVNDNDVDLVPTYNSSHMLNAGATTTVTPSNKILDAVLLAAESFTLLNNATLTDTTNVAYGSNMTPGGSGSSSQIWQMSDILCKSLLSIYMYATVASVLWMFIEGFHLLERVALSVFRRETNFLLFYFIGWFLPLVFITAWVVAMELTTRCYCWANYESSSWKWLIGVPTISALVINAFFLIAIITIVVTKLQANDTAELAQFKKALKATIILFPLLGVSFLFSAFNPNDDGVGESAYFISNAVLQGSQGIFVAVIYCFCNSEVHQAVKRYYYRILLRRGDYRRSSRIAMTSMEGNPLTVAATVNDQRRKSSAAANLHVNNNVTLMMNNIPTSTAATTALLPQQHLVIMSGSTSTTGSDDNANVNYKHVVDVATNEQQQQHVRSSSFDDNNHTANMPTRQPTFRYRVASHSSAAPATSGCVVVPSPPLIAPLSAAAAAGTPPLMSNQQNNSAHSGPAISVSGASKVANGFLGSHNNNNKQHPIADIDDEEEEDDDEESSASKRLNGQIMSNFHHANEALPSPLKIVKKKNRWTGSTSGAGDDSPGTPGDGSSYGGNDNNDIHSSKHGNHVVSNNSASSPVSTANATAVRSKAQLHQSDSVAGF